MKLFLMLAIFACAPTLVGAQVLNTTGTGAPQGACATGNATYTDQASGNYYDCIAGAWHLTALNTGNQSTVTATANAVIPAGLIAISLTVCPAGFTEVSTLNGKTLIGTLAANANAGTTGGQDSINPAGTVSAPVFTGAALATHTHVFTGNAVAAASSAASPKLVTGNTSTGVSVNTTATGTNAAASAGTPSGTNSAPTFTGASFDNRSAFVRVIFCSKN